jgi:hypothetical protein
MFVAHDLVVFFKLAVNNVTDFSSREAKIKIKGGVATLIGA